MHASELLCACSESSDFLASDGPGIIPSGHDLQHIQQAWEMQHFIKMHLKAVIITYAEEYFHIFPLQYFISIDKVSSKLS